MKLSIIIPVYNQEELIIKCLDSIPIREDIEIIVIDDASTDKTKENVKNYMNKETKAIMLIENKTNKGVGVSRNEGIDESKGQYIMFLDSDDYIYTDRFDKVFNELTGEDIVYYGLENNNGHILMPKPSNKKQLCGTVKMIRRDFIKDTRYPDMRFAEDYFFNSDLLKRLPKVKYTNIVLVHYNSPREGSLFDIGKRSGNNAI